MNTNQARIAKTGRKGKLVCVGGCHRMYYPNEVTTKPHYCQKCCRRHFGESITTTQAYWEMDRKK